MSTPNSLEKAYRGAAAALLTPEEYVEAVKVKIGTDPLTYKSRVWLHGNLSPTAKDPTAEPDKDENGYDIEDDDECAVKAGDPEANLLSSDLSYNGGNFLGEPHHAPVLDLDVKHMYVPSSTEGKAHLYLDVPIPWSKYVKLLQIMAECGILEQGYVDASIARGYSAVRLPWISKAKVEAVQNPTPSVAPPSVMDNFKIEADDTLEQGQVKHLKVDGGVTIGPAKMETIGHLKKGSLTVDPADGGKWHYFPAGSVGKIDMVAEEEDDMTFSDSMKKFGMTYTAGATYTVSPSTLKFWGGGFS